jgi:hypothetical protein
MPGTRDYQQRFERARRKFVFLRSNFYFPYTTWSMPSRKGYLPALFLEHTLTFELMHRYNLRRFVWLLWLELQGKSKICNPVDFIWEPGILVGLSESCSQISQSTFFGQHHTWNTVEGHMFRCSDVQATREQINAGKFVFRVSPK